MAQIVDRLVARVVRQPHDGIGCQGSAEAMPRNEEARDRTADQTGDDQAQGRGGDADFERIGDPEPLGDDRRPGDGRAVAPDERGGADEGGDPMGQAERGDAAGRDQVLDHEIDEGQGEQDQERTAAGNQVAEPGVEADAGEEIEQQHVARVECEADLDAERDIGDQRRGGRQETARHRLGNVPAPERLDQAIEPGAGEEHQNGDREGEQPGDVNCRHHE